MTAFTFRDLAFVSSTGRSLLYPTYVQDYLDRVTAADVAAGNTLGLELAVTDAFNTALQAMVADTSLGVSGGVLAQAASLIKASCAMQGARTLPGSLVPLAADMPAPTNFNFVAGDYNRQTGLLGNGSTKYLDSNRANNADSQNSAHIALYGTTWGATEGRAKVPIGRQIGGFNERAFFASTAINLGQLSVRVQSTASVVPHSQPRANGFIGASRNNASTISIRNKNSTVAASQASSPPSSPTLFVFAGSDGAAAGNGGNAASFDDSRLNFYSIGSALDLAILDARITALSNAIQAAIAP